MAQSAVEGETGKKKGEVPKYFCTSLRAPCISNHSELVWVHKSSRRVRGGQEADSKLQSKGEKKPKEFPVRKTGKNTKAEQNRDLGRQLVTVA